MKVSSSRIACQNFQGVFNTTCVRLGAVGQFRELVEAAEKDRPLCETLKKVLKLTKVPPP